MLNFTYYNPTRIVFGKGTIAELEKLVPQDNKVLMLFGGGSIKCNGVYDQVRRALARHAVVELGGIEPNPHYETCLKARGDGAGRKGRFPAGRRRRLGDRRRQVRRRRRRLSRRRALEPDPQLAAGSRRHAAGHGAHPARHRLGNERRGRHLPPSRRGKNSTSSPSTPSRGSPSSIRRRPTRCPSGSSPTARSTPSCRCWNSI